MITISLNQIRQHGPCTKGWEKLLKYLGKTKADDEQFPFSIIIESNGIKDAIWALRCLEDKKPAQLFAISCAQSVLHLMSDKRSIEAVKLAHLYLHGGEMIKNVKAAADTALAAAYAYDAAYNAAYDAEREKQAEWLKAIVDNYAGVKEA